ncbi:hypothetical protein [Antrihabitans sp. YC2-6]|uniref:hypothetical protein n=1 Tax=Antrihabitans sp. YC2-6 TaxID=2799498 RepID=UPI0018F3D245|nr:hypothetical protein [Antrihabitans sp. YC2-6]MBJ8346968.1 hypothetical protein [Antrihabitans sp. YC2-6]
MLLLDVENRVLTHFLGHGPTPTAADSLRRQPPLHRDLFDNFLYTATTIAVGEGTWAMFPTACANYLSAVDGDLQRPPPLIPPAIASTVAEILTQFQRAQPGDTTVDGLGSRITHHQHNLALRLFYELGGDRGDGPAAAGLRVHSKTMAARISDGFLHPALGGHMWSDVPAGPPHRPDGGRDITILRTIAALSYAWRTTPADRPTIERRILDRAHTLGWRTHSPGLIEDSPGRWYVQAPPPDSPTILP